jgi:hypothetical protein
MDRKRSSGTGNDDSQNRHDGELPYKDALEWVALLLSILMMLSHLL